MGRPDRRTETRLLRRHRRSARQSARRHHSRRARRVRHEGRNCREALAADRAMSGARTRPPLDRLSTTWRTAWPDFPLLTTPPAICPYYPAGVRCVIFGDVMHDLGVTDFR